ncbi:MAG: AraC family transcriptional regulator [Holophagales bacterium]|nr:AraC family transcriptional regulator [Holophagales bacterium]
MKRAHRRGSGSCQVELSRLTELGDIELMHGRYRDFRFRRHAHHDRICVAAVQDGTMSHSNPEGTRRLTPGQVLVVEEGQVHWGGATVAGSWSMRSLLIPPRALASLGRGRRLLCPRRRLEPIADPDLADSFLRMHHELEESIGRGESKRRLRALISRVCDHLEEHDLPKAATPIPRSVRLAREFLETHFDQPIGLDQLARRLNTDKFRLARDFSRHVGMPPHAYQVHLRVRAAEELLRQGLPAAEVAARCGFADQSHLTRQFRQANGITPARFRRG